MPSAIALLRGVNVGPARPLPMALLRELCAEVGMKDARTCIQSGNVVFQGPARSLPDMAKRLEKAIERRQGFRPDVIVRTATELRAAIAANPFTESAADDPSHLVVMFCKGPPAPGAAAVLEALPRGRERARLVGREVFIEYPDGIGRSKLTMGAVERALGVPATGRNWKTLAALGALVEAEPEGVGRRSPRGASRVNRRRPDGRRGT
ncbi:MAG: DUF1697 domain-containing protein [Phycisphaeraceae bacterium]|nr:DUF1697 domain-containing protein [Phycisphaeraceae bacterium]